MLQKRFWGALCRFLMIVVLNHKYEVQNYIPQLIIRTVPYPPRGRAWRPYYLWLFISDMGQATPEEYRRGCLSFTTTPPPFPPISMLGRALAGKTKSRIQYSPQHWTWGAGGWEALWILNSFYSCYAPIPDKGCNVSKFIMRHALKDFASEVHHS